MQAGDKSFLEVVRALIEQCGQDESVRPLFQGLIGLEQADGRGGFESQSRLLPSDL